MQAKVCTKCGEEKEVVEFPKDRSCKFGVSSRCKGCARSYSKIWHEENRKERLEYKKRWRKENREKILEGKKKWRQENPDKRREYNAKHRAMKLQATPPWLCENSISELSEIYANCPEGYHVDHIVPLRGKTVSGLHVPWNLQYLTPEENLSKGSRWWPDMWEELDEQEA